MKNLHQEHEETSVEKALPKTLRTQFLRIRTCQRPALQLQWKVGVRGVTASATQCWPPQVAPRRGHVGNNAEH